LLSRSYDSALSFSHNDTLLATWDLGGNCSGSVRIRRSRGATARCWGGAVEHEDRLFLRGKRAITKDSENQTSAAGASPRVLRAPQGCTSFAPYVNAPPLDEGPSFLHHSPELTTGSLTHTSFRSLTPPTHPQLLLEQMLAELNTSFHPKPRDGAQSLHCINRERAG
jgi:hypothetical protein